MFNSNNLLFIQYIFFNEIIDIFYINCIKILSLLSIDILLFTFSSHDRILAIFSILVFDLLQIVYVRHHPIELFGLSYLSLKIFYNIAVFYPLPEPGPLPTFFTNLLDPSLTFKLLMLNGLK
jgi:hypothetical protein